MRRRTFIVLAGGGVPAAAGCLGTGPAGTGGKTPTERGTTTADGTSTSTDDPRPVDVTVESATLQYGVVTPTSPDSIGVSFTDTQYLVASVRVEGTLARDEFALRVGDGAYAPATVDRLYRTTWGDEQRYQRGRERGLVLFALPPEATGMPRLTWPGGERALDDLLETPVGGPPPRLSAALALPATHEDTEVPPVIVEVTNEGETAGRFLGALNRVGPLVAHTPIARVSELVPAGETVTVTVADDWGGLPGDARVGDGDPDVTYHLHHAGGEDSAEIRLV